MIDRSIIHLGRILTLLFVLLILRALWIGTVGGAPYRENPYNPRAHSSIEGRGSITARDGTILAVSRAAQRLYPFGPSLAQSVGYLSGRYGEAGLEAVYDRLLRPPNESESLGERLLEVIDRRSHHPARDGGRVVTTIDPKIQAALYGALRDHAHAAGIVLEPRSGAVVAIASVPSYDPNELEALFPQLAHDPESALLNRVVEGLYPPGSTFKIVTAATALEAGVARPESTFYDPGFLDIGSYRVHDDEGEATGEQSLSGAFALSSNVDFARLALTLGSKRFYEGMHAFGLGDSMEFTIPTIDDRLPDRERVSDSLLAQLAFGQADLLVTPLRMALITEAVANGGIMRRPYLVADAVAPNGIGELTRPETLATPMTPSTAAILTEMMVRVVNRGTGRSAALDQVQVAGKTGTATNANGAPHSWFVGFAPADAPRYVIAILVENGGYGAAVAAPIARRVLAIALEEGKVEGTP